MNALPFQLLSLLWILGLISCKSGSPVASADGDRLEQFYDGLAVESHWILGKHVDWRTGKPDGKPIPVTGYHTHCSAFVAAACDRLGVYILRPPEHPQEFLADAQADWLASGDGKNAGWVRVNTPAAAQSDASAGLLVVAIYKNPNPREAGHVALVRPGNKSADALAREGVNIIQAGRNNYQRTTMKQGFEHHPGAWENGELRYFAHRVDWGNY